MLRAGRQARGLTAAPLLVGLLATAACHREAGGERRPWPAPSQPATPELDALFFEALPALVIAQADPALASDEALAALRAACRDTVATATCSPLLELALSADQLRGIDEDPLGVGPWLLDVHRRRLNRALADAGYPYYLTTFVVGDEQPQGVILSHRVEEVLRVRAPAGRIDAVVLRRGDALSWNPQLMGYTDPSEREVVVFADVVDAELAARVAPILAGDPREDTAALWRAALESELGVEDARTLGRLFASRHQLWTTAAERLRERFLVEIGDPTGPVSSADERQLVERVLEPAELGELNEVEDALRRSATLRSLRRAELGRTAVHEAQHRVDLDDGLAGPVATRHGPEVAAELSATLAEIAHAPSTARSALVRALSLARDPSLRGTIEGAAAVLVIEAMATAMAVDEGDWSRALEIHDADAWATGARNAWRAHFGRPLAALYLEADAEGGGSGAPGAQGEPKL